MKYLLTLFAIASAAVREFHWTVTQFNANYDGVIRPVLGINNQPGHLTKIEVDSGDIIKVYVTNGLLGIGTALHWHGMHQRGSQSMDGAASVTQGQAGTYWWHSHYKGQYMDGLRGPLIIREVNCPYPASNDVIVQMADWYHETSSALLEQYLSNTLNPNGNEPIFKTGLINGNGVFDCSKTNLPCSKTSPTVFSVHPNQQYRLRLINMAALAAFHVSLDNHKLTVVEVDGNYVEPYTIDSLIINIGQRYSVLVEAPQSDRSFWLRTRMFHGSPWTSGPLPTGFHPDVKAIWSYGVPSTPRSNPLNLDPSNTLQDINLHPLLSRQAPPITINDLSLRYSFAFESRPGDTYQKAYSEVSILAQNGVDKDVIINSSFTPPLEPILLAVKKGSSLDQTSHPIYVKLGQVVQMVIMSRDPGEHPFHLHGDSFWVMAEGTAYSTAELPSNAHLNAIQNPLYRDTATVAACPTDTKGNCKKKGFGYTIIRFIADNPGVWMFHCHIEWHMAAGLAVNFVVGKEVIRQTLSISDQGMC